MSMLRSRNGQSTAEYAVVIAIVLGAVVGMQTYIKRGFQAKLKAANDKLTGITASSEPTADAGLKTAFTGKKTQYEPYYAESHVQVDSNNASGLTSSVTETMTGTAASGFSVKRAGGDIIRDIKRSDAAGNVAQTEHDWSKKTADDQWQ